MVARLFAIVGTVLFAVGFLATVFNIPPRLPQAVLTTLLVGGVICLVAHLVLGEIEQRKAP
jgi:hypothetical protein